MKSRKVQLVMVTFALVASAFVARFDFHQLGRVNYDPSGPPLALHWRHRHPSASSVTALIQGSRVLLRTDNYSLWRPGDHVSLVREVLGTPELWIGDPPRRMLWALEIENNWGTEPKLFHYLEVRFDANERITHLTPNLDIPEEFNRP